MKSKTTAGLFALFLGGFGVHKFYLGQPIQGLLYLVFCWSFIPVAISFVEAIIYFTMSEASFNLKYNGGIGLAAAQPQNIVVNVANTASTGGGDTTERLRSLLELKSAGGLTEDEYQAQKQKLLAMG
ncbi:MAG TPA: NINE protein [Longimicrobiaceae bacterium]|jgi:TM2 domain-containing membrane protein YozV